MKCIQVVELTLPDNWISHYSEGIFDHKKSDMQELEIVEHKFYLDVWNLRCLHILQQYSLDRQKFESKFMKEVIFGAQNQKSSVKIDKINFNIVDKMAEKKC